MREIKFRGIRKDTGEWVFGYYGYKDLTDEHFIIVPTFDVHSDTRPQYFTDHLVDHYSVGQFTVLKDKNGVEVYEGDRFRSLNSAGKSIGTIEFVDGRFKVVWDEPNYGCLNDIISIHAENGEVIGNIFGTDTTESAQAKPGADIEGLFNKEIDNTLEEIFKKEE